jgi:hypothetical protein
MVMDPADQIIEALRQARAELARLRASHQDLEQMLRAYLQVAPAFRLKPVGTSCSDARRQQESHIALEDRARKFLAELPRDCNCGNPSVKYFGPHDPDCPAAAQAVADVP